jgi:lysophospholipase L1-like esterase
MIRRCLAIILSLAAACVAHGELTLVEQWPVGEGACLDTPLRLTFDRPPVLGSTGRIEVCRASDWSPVESIELGAASYVDRFGANGGFMLRFEEFASTDLEGMPLEVSQRDAASRQLNAGQAAAESVAKLLAGSDGWNPAAQQLLRIVLVGDSTVCNYPPESRTRGWGQFIQGYFKESAKVINHAASGRSTKTFIAEGRWQKVLAEKPHYVLIQFGHNDSHAPDRPESTDAATTYREFLRRYIDDARAIGATPILVTPMVRRIFENGILRDGLAPYAAAMKEVAAEKNAAVIDLHASSARLVSQLGEAGSAGHANSSEDRTHFSEAGAKAMAALIMQDLPAAAPSLREHLY